MMAAQPGIFPGAKVRLIQRWNAGRPRPSGAASVNCMILHIAVTPRSTSTLYGFFANSTSVCSHFFVAEDGSVEQYMDAAGARDAASYRAAARSISVETAGGSGADLEKPWSAAQVETLAQLAAWAHKRFRVPLRLMTSSKTSEAGIGWHRLGVPDSAAQKARGVSRTGGELWSSATGKVCPGAARQAQVPEIVARARQIVGTSTTTPTPTPAPAPTPTPSLEDDMTPEQDTMLRAVFAATAVRKGIERQGESAARQTAHAVVRRNGAATTWIQDSADTGTAVQGLLAEVAGIRAVLSGGDSALVLKAVQQALADHAAEQEALMRGLVEALEMDIRAVIVEQVGPSAPIAGEAIADAVLERLSERFAS